MTKQEEKSSEWAVGVVCGILLAAVAVVFAVLAHRRNISSRSNFVVSLCHVILIANEPLLGFVLFVALQVCAGPMKCVANSKPTSCSIFNSVNVLGTDT